MQRQRVGENVSGGPRRVMSEEDLPELQMRGL